MYATRVRERTMVTVMQLQLYVGHVVTVQARLLSNFHQRR